MQRANVYSPCVSTFTLRTGEAAHKWVLGSVALLLQDDLAGQWRAGGGGAPHLQRLEACSTRRHAEAQYCSAVWRRLCVNRSPSQGSGHECNRSLQTLYAGESPSGAARRGEHGSEVALLPLACSRRCAQRTQPHRVSFLGEGKCMRGVCVFGILSGDGKVAQTNRQQQRRHGRLCNSRQELRGSFGRCLPIRLA